MSEGRSRRRVPCDTCKQLFNPAYLTIHKRMHTGEKPYKCSTCNQRFMFYSGIVHHTKKKHPDVCWKSGGQLMYDFISGDKSTGSSLPTKCGSCPELFPNEAALRAHSRIHTRVNWSPFECKTCHKWFVYKGTYDNHRCSRTEKGVEDEAVSEMKVKCLHCSRTFQDDNQLAGHMRVHNADKLVRCSTCFKFFRNNQQLTEHRRTAHVTDKPLFSCPKCGKQFSKKFRLGMHMRSHMTLSHHTGGVNKPGDLKKHCEVYRCSVCGKVWPDKISLVSHLHNHIDKKHSFRCKVCNAGFARRQHLEFHSRIHENLEGKPYKCTHCRAGFMKEYICRMHMSRIHNVRLGTGLMTEVKRAVHECVICWTVVNTRQDLVKHMKSHDKQRERSKTERPRPDPVNASTNISKGNSDSSSCLKTGIGERNTKKESKSSILDARDYNQSVLSTHHVDHTLLTSTTIDKTTGRVLYLCDVCYTTFTIKENLKRHVRNRAFDHGRYLTKGPEPGNNKRKRTTKTFETIKKLKPTDDGPYVSTAPVTNTTHTRISTDTGNDKTTDIKMMKRYKYVCDVCGLSYTRRLNMRQHRNKHTEEAFKRAGVRKEHLTKSELDITRSTETISSTDTAKPNRATTGRYLGFDVYVDTDEVPNYDELSKGLITGAPPHSNVADNSSITPINESKQKQSHESEYISGSESKQTCIDQPEQQSSEKAKYAPNDLPMHINGDKNRKPPVNESKHTIRDESKQGHIVGDQCRLKDESKHLSMGKANQTSTDELIRITDKNSNPRSVFDVISPLNAFPTSKECDVSRDKLYVPYLLPASTTEIHTTRKPLSSPTTEIHNPRQPLPAPTTEINKTHKPLPAPTTEIHNTRQPLPAPTTEIHATRQPLPASTTEIHNTRQPLPAPTTEIKKTHKPLSSPTTEIHNTRQPLPAPTTEIHATRQPLPTPTTEINKTHKLLPASTTETHTTHTPLPTPTTEMDMRRKPIPSLTTEILTTHKPLPASTNETHTAHKPLPAPTTEIHTTPNPLPSPTTEIHMTNKPLPASTAEIHTVHKPLPALTTEKHMTQKPLPASATEIHTTHKTLPASTTEIHTTHTPLSASTTEIHTTHKTLPASTTEIHTTHTPLSASTTEIHTTHKTLPASTTEIHTTHTPLSASTTEIHTTHKTLPASTTEIHTTHKTLPASATEIHTTHTPLSASTTEIHTTHKTLPASTTETQSTQKPLPASATEIHTTHTPLSASTTEIHTTHKPLAASTTETHTTHKPLPASATEIHTTHTPLSASTTEIHVIHTPLYASTTEIHTTRKPCPGCTLPILEGQRTLVCKLCCSRFCVTCSAVPRDLYDLAFVPEGDSPVVWLCSVCKPLLPKFTLLLHQLGEFEESIDDRISDLEKKLAALKRNEKLIVETNSIKSENM